MLALVYKGAATIPGCPEAVAALLRRAGYVTQYIGGRGYLNLTADNLAKATIYAQPGGGDLDYAWKVMKSYKTMIQTYIRNGGHYLGHCLGGYLAGNTPGFNILPGDTDEYIIQPGATVHNDNDTVVKVNWKGTNRIVYFQDGPIFKVSGATILAKYLNGNIASCVSLYGKGKVGVVGPHPEADDTWFEDINYPKPYPFAYDLGVDLIRELTK